MTINFQDAKNLFAVVAPYAPKLASLLLGSYAGIAVTILENVCGLPSGSPTSDILTALNNPSNLPLLKQHEEAIASLANADRSNARSLIGSNGFNHIIALLFCLLFCVIVICQLLGLGNTGSTVTSEVYTLVTGVISYYFGSVSNSDK
jgi:hypothetical protein